MRNETDAYNEIGVQVYLAKIDREREKAINAHYLAKQNRKEQNKRAVQVIKKIGFAVALAASAMYALIHFV